ncbi:LysR substrate-binding domain-containing protein [Paenibacillus ottowii]
MEFNHLDAIVQGVISGLGVSLVPYSVIQRYIGENKLRYFPFPAEYKTIQISLIRKKDSLMTSAFEKLVQAFQTYVWTLKSRMHI